MTPEPVSSYWRTRSLVLAPARLAGDDVDHRGRDGLGDELEGPIDLLELLVLPGQSLVVRLLAPDLGRRARRRRRAGEAAVPGRGGLVTCAATNGPPRSKATPRNTPKVRVASSTSGVRVRAISDRSPLRGKGREEAGSSPRRDRADGGPVRVWTSINIRSATPPSQREARLDLTPFAVIRGTVRIEWPDTRRCRDLRRPGARKNRRTCRRFRGMPREEAVAYRPDSLRSISKSLRLMCESASVSSCVLS